MTRMDRPERFCCAKQGNVAGAGATQADADSQITLSGRGSPFLLRSIHLGVPIGRKLGPTLAHTPADSSRASTSRFVLGVAASHHHSRTRLHPSPERLPSVLGRSWYFCVSFARSPADRPVGL